MASNGRVPSEPKTHVVPPVVLDDGDGLDAYRVGQHAPGVDLASGQAALIITRGPSAGSAFLLEGRRVELGRSAGDIALTDHTVSRRHAAIERVGGHFLIEDLDSLNGVYVNGQAVKRCALRNGDLIQVGLFKLVFLSPDDE